MLYIDINKQTNIVLKFTRKQLMTSTTTPPQTSCKYVFDLKM